MATRDLTLPAIRRLRLRPDERVLIVGATPSAQAIVDTIREHSNTHYEIVGFISDEAQSFTRLGVPGKYGELARIAAARGVGEIILAVNGECPPTLFDSLLECQKLGIRITPLPVFLERITGRLPIEQVGQEWYAVLPLDHPGMHGLYPLLKRSLDLVVAVVGLLLFALLFPFLALALKLDSPGPILYKQTRVGRGGRVFTVFKLRSMVSGAEAGQAVWASKNDPRITRLGRWLRKTRIDEFPQFINILRGEMSAVGPRPERPEFVDRLAAQIPFYRLRSAIKPGMAGWAMVHQDYVDSVEGSRIRVGYDLYYIKHQSIGLDILILFQTLEQMVKLKGR